MQILTGVEVPQGRTGARVDSFEGLGIVAKRDQAALGGHGSGEAVTVADLTVAPDRFIGLQIIREEYWFVIVARAVPTKLGNHNELHPGIGEL